MIFWEISSEYSIYANREFFFHMLDSKFFLNKNWAYTLFLLNLNLPCYTCNLKRVLKKSIICLSIAVISLLTVNNALFIHSHRLPDGSIVTHAHPFKKSSDTDPFKSHRHNQGEYMLIQLLKILLVFVGFLLVVFLIPFSHSHISCERIIYGIFIVSHTESRAPPCNL